MEFPQVSDAPISVLYVDDEPALLEIGKIYLERAEGISVTTVENPDDAMKLLASGGFDAIVSDYQMPGMDGIGFLKYVRSTYGDLPFLLFTGKGREEIVIEALNNGADYYVEKAGIPEPQFADLVHKIRLGVSRCRTEKVLRKTYNELRSSYEQMGAFNEELRQREEKITGMEKALRESEQTYEAIFAYTGSATAIFEEDMTISLANAAFADLCGYTREEIEGRMKWNRFVPADELERLTTYHRSRRIDPKSAPEHYNIRFVDRYGKEHIAYMTVGLIPGTSRTIASHTDVTELKETQDRLALFGNILDDSRNEIYIFDPETLRIFLVNSGGLKNLGYSMEEITTLTPVDLKPECTDESFRSLIAPLLSGKKDFISFTTFHRRKDGTQYPVEVHLQLSKATSPPVFVAIIIDITSRLEVEEENRILRHVIDKASSAITIHEYGGKVVYANDRVLEMLGYTRDEFFDTRLEDMIVPASPTWIADHIEEVKKKGTTFFESKRIRKDGSTFPVLVHLTAVQWGEDEVLLTISDDITAWKKTEDALKKSEEQLSFALSATNDGIWDFDIIKNEATFSPQYLRMLGYEPGEFSSNVDDWWQHVHPDEREDVKSAIFDCIETQEDYFKEFRMKKKDGQFIWVLARGRVMETDSEGKPVRMVGMHSDITGRKRVEEALRLANRKMQLLSGITRHDILNQAMALNGYLSLTDDLNSDPALREYLRKMHLSAGSIERTIAFTRDYERLGMNEPKWIALGDVISGFAITDGMTFSFTCENTEVFADPLLGTVFSNLMDNTLRHAKGATVVSVSCSSTEDGALIISWEDDGSGVSDKLKKKIFERGFGDNTGLGLFFVREILSITGISIHECGTEDEGACFEIIVPPGGWRET